MPKRSSHNQTRTRLPREVHSRQLAVAKLPITPPHYRMCPIAYGADRLRNGTPNKTSESARPGQPRSAQHFRRPRLSCKDRQLSMDFDVPQNSERLYISETAVAKADPYYTLADS